MTSPPPLSKSEDATLLVEILTEELPPLLLADLAAQFSDKLFAALKDAGFANEKTRIAEFQNSPLRLATPRRLAALIENVPPLASAREILRKGPQVSSALDSRGKPTPALLGFIKSCGGGGMDDLCKITQKNREYFAFRKTLPGESLANALPLLAEKTLLSLSAPRLMRWGENDFRFVRPIRNVAMMHGKKAIAGSILGIKSRNKTKGHRFLCEKKWVMIPSADEYISIMESEGKVAVSFDAREQEIRKQMLSELKQRNAHIKSPEFVEPKDSRGVIVETIEERGLYTSIQDNDLVSEVTAMCEQPHIFVGDIDDISLMRGAGEEHPWPWFELCIRKHQKCFAIHAHSFDTGGVRELLPKFLFVADCDPKDPREMIRGFETVLDARLRDALFYYKEDRKLSADECIEKLKRISYHNKLGSQYDRAQRIRAIAEKIASLFQLSTAEKKEVTEAARLCKADLPMLMINEYPELEGVMAARYFTKSDSVRDALEFQNEYRLAEILRIEDHEINNVAICISLANNLEKIAGFFGIGVMPSGSKDPHGLRRAAATVANILLRREIIRKRRIKTPMLIQIALDSFGEKIADAADAVYDFIVDRIRNFDKPVELFSHKDIIEAVLSQNPQEFGFIIPKLQAFHKMQGGWKLLPLAAANKRINNIIRKSESDGGGESVDESLLICAEEKTLFQAMRKAEKESQRLIAKEDFTGALETLAGLAEPVDAFFDSVLVNADDKKVRANRFALLAELRTLLNQVADISKLAV